MSWREILAGALYVEPATAQSPQIRKEQQTKCQRAYPLPPPPEASVAVPCPLKAVFRTGIKLGEPLTSTVSAPPSVNGDSSENAADEVFGINIFWPLKLNWPKDKVRGYSVPSIVAEPLPDTLMCEPQLLCGGL